ncbi:sensor domain-containing diguanylate cyclase [Ectothiorhodospira lacustris]|uniref:sensor domain-containing diguanylate cyclase n=1 Tax=Ectothiorhodospira lacustris TaxID=2899127 RepID=UPI001EE8E16C|nr:diguanylate cyclase [Ectothiorhodospira lacustris]MCG5501107.1 diguanylate cyclase [Ectothiorhodospira lacustris]MCG5510837.1 diguanylate cyclase [Ectothiorhodospira lacustris]MCG5522617.1 diguanylate cyclase [Ectothiorhodospira lacustris]
MEKAATGAMAVFRNLPLPLLSVDIDGTILEANPSARDRLALPEDRSQWPDLTHFLFSLNVAGLADLMESCCTLSRPQQLRAQCRDANGHKFEVLVHLNRLDADSDRHFLCVLTEVNESRDESPGLPSPWADGLTESSLRWRFALFGAGDGVWDWDLESNDVVYCARFRQIIGFSDAELDKSFEQWVSLVHPDDLRGFSGALQDHLQGDSSHYMCEFRMRCKDGGWKWVLARGRVARRDEGGRPLRVVGTLSDIGARKKLESELRRMATTDFLTGLFNRRHFIARMTDELARVRRRPHQPSTLLMVDLDYFKNINDTYGHSSGDLVLQHFADILQSCLRRMDLPARTGGEEFAILLPGTTEQEALVLAERLRRKVKSTPAVTPGAIIAMTVSIGITRLSPEDGSPDASLSRADEALYKAKHNGRNQVALAPF